MSAFSEFAAELLAGLRESLPPPLLEQESESGIGTARALANLLNQLSVVDPATQARLSDADQQRTFALALAQVDLSGQRVDLKNLNKPDISFVGGEGADRRRVNIEIETGDVRKHATQVNKDRNAHNIFVKINPWTGEIEHGFVRLPNGQLQKLPDKAAVEQALRTLPRAQTDATLRYNPAKGVQERASARAKPVRAAQASRGARPMPRPRPRPAAPTRHRSRQGGRGAREFEWEWEFEQELGRAADEMEG